MILSHPETDSSPFSVTMPVMNSGITILPLSCVDFAIRVWRVASAQITALLVRQNDTCDHVCEEASMERSLPRNRPGTARS